jgi:hypothetical protein
MEKLLVLVAIPLFAVAQESAQPGIHAPAAPEPATAPAPRESGGSPDAERSEPDSSKQRGVGYIGAGVGAGRSNVSGQGTALFVNLEAGLTITPRLLCGIDVSRMTSASAANSFGVTSSLKIWNLGLVLSFFPVERGFFLRGGVGRSGLTITEEGPTLGGTFSREASTSGFNVIGGLGYSFWLGHFNVEVAADATTQRWDEMSQTRLLIARVGAGWY